MTARSGAMHVARNKRTYMAKSGEQRVYESVLVRRTYRDGGKVRQTTVAMADGAPCPIDLTRDDAAGEDVPDLVRAAGHAQSPVSRRKE